VVLLPPRASAPRSKNPVLRVGQRVFVSAERGAVLTDDAGHDTPHRLADGAEVEIVAWRPRGATGTRYRIHSRPDGLEGWLQAGELRAAAIETPAPEPTVPPSPPAGRKFGQRR